MPAPHRLKRVPTGDIVARLRSVCLAHDGAVEKLSHGAPTWFTKLKGKVFAIYDNHHHPEGHLSVWVPSLIEAQRALVEAKPSRYWVPPYFGHKGWVAIVLDTQPDWTAVASLIDEGFELVCSPARKPRTPKPTQLR
jgi:predicted DNA-binding protein (MmcQ/YjbR family)